MRPSKSIGTFIYSDYIIALLVDRGLSTPANAAHRKHVCCPRRVFR